MTHEASFRTVFPAKKGTKEAFEAPCICFNALPEAFGRYSGKVTLYPSVKKDTKQSTRMLVSGIFKQLGTFVVVRNGLRKFSKIGNVSSFR